MKVSFNTHPKLPLLVFFLPFQHGTEPRERGPRESKGRHHLSFSALAITTNLFQKFHTLFSLCMHFLKGISVNKMSILRYLDFAFVLM